METHIHMIFTKSGHNLENDWSLVTGRGGNKTGGGEHVKYYPCEKGGDRKSLSHAEAGYKKCIFYMVA